MPTTSGELALSAMEGLRQARVDFALLHGYDLLGSDETSDIDIVVADDPVTVVRATTPFWQQAGLFPIVLWPYDASQSTGVFLSTSDGVDGVHLDMLHDPEGRGTYGIRSGGLLQNKVSRDLAPVVRDEARLVYLWRKRLVKGQVRELEVLRSVARGMNSECLATLSVSLTGSTAASDGLSGLPVKPTRPSVFKVDDLMRRLRRIRRPIGGWAHVLSPRVGGVLHTRLGAFLIVVATGEVPAPLVQPTWYFTRVAPVRYRAGVFVSVGERIPSFGNPDLVVTSDDADVAASQLVETMASRILA